MWIITILLYLLGSLFILTSFCEAEKIRFISTEHPAVTYYNPKYISYANLTSRRYGRGDPFYYVGLHMQMLWPIPNNITLSGCHSTGSAYFGIRWQCVVFVFYEWLTNRYKRGFVEMHWRICDLIHKDKFFGSALKQGAFDQACPFPPGAYNLYNMTIPIKQIPRNFPFQKGRIYCNLTSTDNNDLVGSGYIDMEIKEINIKAKKKKN